MRKYYSSLQQLSGQIKGDYMLMAAYAAPLLMGIVFRFGIPLLEGILTVYFQRDTILLPYYPLFDVFLSMIAPLMFCFSCTMILLEEVDDKVARYFMITPLRKGGYLFTRIGFPAVLSFLFTILILALFRISALPVRVLAAAAILSTVLAVIISLLIVSLSANKLEGMAVTKLASMLTLGVFPPFFLEAGVQPIFMRLPSYWLGRFIRDVSLLNFLIGAVISGVWIGLLSIRFNKKVSV